MGIQNASIKDPSHFLMDGILSIQKTAEGKPQSRVIKGYMSIPKVDAENEIIDRKAYPDAINEVRNRLSIGRPVPIFIEHRRKELSLPIGSLVDAGEDDRGLWFKGKIASGPIGDSVWSLIDQGILYGCSMGGDAVKTHNKYDHKINKDVRVIDNMVFRELSLTGLPVNDDAVFSIAKSMYCSHEGKCASHKQGKCLCKGQANNIIKSLRGLDNEIENEVISQFDKAVQDYAAAPQDAINKEKVMQSLGELAKILGIEDRLKTMTGQPAEGGEAQPGQPEVQPEAQPEQPDQEQQPEVQETQPQEEQPEQQEQTEQPVEQPEQPGVEQPEEVPPEVQPQKLEQDEDEAQPQTTCPMCAKEAEEGDECPECKKEREMDEDNADGTTSTATYDQDEKQRERTQETAEHKDEDEEEEENENEDMKKSDDMEDGEKALVEPQKMVTLESLSEKIEGIESLLSKRGGEKEKMDLVKCPDCDTVFEKADYPPKFCPKCGADLDAELDTDFEKSEPIAEAETEMEYEKAEDVDTDEEEDVEEDEAEDEEDEEVYECEHCKSTFGKSLGYKMNFCPECGDIVKSTKMSVAIASSPKGAKTKYEKKPAAKKGGDMSVAIATNPQGATTKYKSRSGNTLNKNLDVKIAGIQEETGHSVQNVKKGEGSYINPNTKEVDNENNSTIHDWDEKFTPRYGGVDSAIFSNYQVDRLAKSLEEKIDAKFESIRKSAGRKSIVPSDEPKKIEKSVEEKLEQDKNRFLAQVFLGKVKV